MMKRLLSLLLCLVIALGMISMTAAAETEEPSEIITLDFKADIAKMAEEAPEMWEALGATDIDGVKRVGAAGTKAADGLICTAEAAQAMVAWMQENLSWYVGSIGSFNNASNVNRLSLNANNAEYGLRHYPTVYTRDLSIVVTVPATGDYKLSVLSYVGVGSSAKMTYCPWGWRSGNWVDLYVNGNMVADEVKMGNAKGEGSEGETTYDLGTVTLTEGKNTITFDTTKNTFNSGSQVYGFNLSSMTLEPVAEEDLVAPTAEVAGTEYSNIADAIAAADETNVVKVLTSGTVKESLTVPAGKTVNLDLNGNTIENTGSSIYDVIVVKAGGKLSVCGSGTIANKSAGNYAAINNSGEIAEITGDVTISSLGVYGIYNADGATVGTIGGENGTVSVTGASYGLYLENNNRVAMIGGSNADVTVKGATNGIYANKATIGTIGGTNSAITVPGVKSGTAGTVSVKLIGSELTKLGGEGCDIRIGYIADVADTAYGADANYATIALEAKNSTITTIGGGEIRCRGYAYGMKFSGTNVTSFGTGDDYILVSQRKANVAYIALYLQGGSKITTMGGEGSQVSVIGNQRGVVLDYGSEITTLGGEESQVEIKTMAASNPAKGLLVKKGGKVDAIAADGSTVSLARFNTGSLVSGGLQQICVEGEIGTIGAGGTVSIMSYQTGADAGVHTAIDVADFGKVGTIGGEGGKVIVYLGTNAIMQGIVVGEYGKVDTIDNVQIAVNRGGIVNNGIIRELADGAVIVSTDADAFPVSNSGTMLVSGGSYAHASGAAHIFAGAVIYASDKGLSEETVNVSLEDGTVYACYYIADGSASELRIATQPADTKADVGETFSFAVEAAGEGELTYQWYHLDPATGKWELTAATGSTYTGTMTDAMVNSQVVCVISNAQGDFTVSQAVTLKLKRGYYQEEIEKTVESVKELLTEDEPYLLFPMVSDIHYKSSAVAPDSFDYCIENMKTLGEELDYDFVLCMGDNTDGDTTQEVTADRATYMVNSFNQLGVPFYQVIGNHDDNRYGDVTFTNKQLYEIYLSHIDDVVFDTSSMYKTNYYKDFDTLNLRFVFLNSNRNGNYGYSPDTCDWFEEVMQTSKSVIVVTHMSPVPEQNGDPDRYGSDAGSTRIREICANADNFLIMFSGHNHYDGVFDDPILSYTMNCQKFSNATSDEYPDGVVKPAREVETATEDCFDIVVVRPESGRIDTVRFGGGEDKTFLVEPTVHTCIDEDSDKTCDLCGDALTPEVEVVPFTIPGCAPNLESELEMGIAVPKASIPEDLEFTAIVKQISGGEVVATFEVPQAEWKTYTAALDMVYVKMAAKCMADDFSIEVTDQYGNVWNEPYTTSYRTYVMNNFSKGDAARKTLFVDMLNYGAAAQQRFGYNVDDLANKELTAEQQAMSLSGTVTLTNKQVMGTNNLGTTVSLESRILVYSVFKGIDPETMYAQVTYTDARGNEVTNTILGKDFELYNASLNAYKICVNTLVPADVDCVYTMTVYNADGTVYDTATEGLGSYLTRNIAKDPVFGATINFGMAAKKFFVG